MKGDQRLFLGVSQSIMFSEHEWKDEEWRLNKNDRCRKEPEENPMRSDDMGLASLDCVDLLDPELLAEEHEPEPQLLILMERRKIDKAEIEARRHGRWKFRSWF